MKHTKGNWKVEYKEDEFHKIQAPHRIRTSDIKDNDLMADYRGGIICSFDESHGNREHSYNAVEANAKLIAAAPELLDLLKRFISAPLHEKARGETNRLFLEEMKEAIKKAES